MGRIVQKRQPESEQTKLTQRRKLLTIPTGTGNKFDILHCLQCSKRKILQAAALSSPGNPARLVTYSI